MRSPRVKPKRGLGDGAGQPGDIETKKDATQWIAINPTFRPRAGCRRRSHRVGFGVVRRYE
jgi:hypothetical protein